MTTATRTTQRATATTALVVGAVAVSVVILCLLVWSARLVVLLTFLAYTLAATMRPGVERLTARGVPRTLAVAAHFVAVGAFLALLGRLFVPLALDQVQAALHARTSGATTDVHGLEWLEQRALAAVEPQLRALAHPVRAISTAEHVVAILGWIAFTLTTTVYWLTERDRLVALVLAVSPRRRRATIRDAWLLVDLKLAAVIRTKLTIVAATAALLSFGFWLIGLPYYLVVGTFAGLVEALPVVGPLIAGITAILVALTVSWQLALTALGVVAGLRLVQDYALNPRLFGRAVHLPPLVVLVAVSVISVLIGSAWVLLAVPLTALVSTLFDVVVRKQNPAEEPVPTVLSRVRRTLAEHRRARAEVDG
jgi:predicted PurR-regulated permease PerM